MTVWALIEKARADEGVTTPDTAGDLLDEEWDLLSRPTSEKQDEDFRAVPKEGVPRGFEDLLEQVVRVPRLREVQALVGFTRVDAPEGRSLEPRGLVRLRNGPTDWVPAVGEAR